MTASRFLPFVELIPDAEIHIGASKSLTNRLLVLQKLLPNLCLKNISTSEDSRVLQEALESGDEIIDVHHAGTAMRFLTAYFALTTQKKIILTGSERMKERPIAPLVEALRSLGADIQYAEKEGYPPLEIHPKELSGNAVCLSASVSSQYITALCLIGAFLPKGLQITLEGKITSQPYIEMTLNILEQCGISTEWKDSVIRIAPLDAKNLPEVQDVFIESDWSSASYVYSFAAIGKKHLVLSSFQKESWQGDAAVAEIYKTYFGVNTEFLSNQKIRLSFDEHFICPDYLDLNLNACPDIAQTLCVTATALQIPFHFTGLHTLKIKETDRLSALQKELKKIGCKTEITSDSISTISFAPLEKDICISTYQDHRMAMSFAPFMLCQSLHIEQPEVVKKSYPEFWQHVEQITRPVSLGNE